ncbi:hypothetical protein [Candidatus Contubernalis alkaliaceticus]|nr:hypothetical protein [Candidatus Contubernalis alkalaceticus]UNC91048.1 hypothetical protein HUE98_02480 [Candidatus Contubernalis alkalaceticus]
MVFVTALAYIFWYGGVLIIICMVFIGCSSVNIKESVSNRTENKKALFE